MKTSTGLLDQVRDFANGDAWGRFAALYSPFLVGWLRRRGVPGHDADDLVQEVFRVVAVELVSPSERNFRHLRVDVPASEGA